MAAVVRPARRTELDAVYRMGFDVWADGNTLEKYLSVCRASTKYAGGKWFVLVEDRRLLSSLIVYRLSAGWRGLGSISTPPVLRGRGYASRLIREVCAHLEAARGVEAIFLHSDIAPEFYRPLGFRSLATKRQRKPGTVCMVRSHRSLGDINAQEAPSYF